MARKKKKDKEKFKEELLTRKKAALQAELGRARLLKALVDKKKRPVNILARVEDKIPSTFTRKDEHKTSFLSKGRLV